MTEAKKKAKKDVKKDANKNTKKTVKAQANELQLYSGFAWAVPQAFGAALHACRFEQGDVLYSDAAAYDESKRGKPPSGYHIQVLDPPRTSRAVSAEGEGQRFFSNWESPVRFEWMDYRKKTSEQRKSSQGGLFTCLWRGDLDALDESRQQELVRPKLLRDLQACVADSTAAIVDQLGQSKRTPGQKNSAAPRGRLFVIAIDLASDASRAKVQSIARPLEAKFEIGLREFLPADLELTESAHFHPALRLLGITIATEDDSQIEGVLRDILYAGGKAAGKEGGRFQLTRHGSLVELP